MTRGAVDAIRARGRHPDTRSFLRGGDRGHTRGAPRRPLDHRPAGPLLGAHQYLDHYVGGGTGGGKYARSYAQENVTSASTGVLDDVRQERSRRICGCPQVHAELRAFEVRSGLRTVTRLVGSRESGAS